MRQVFHQFQHSTVLSYGFHIPWLWGHNVFNKWTLCTIPTMLVNIKHYANIRQTQGLYSLSGKTSYRKISWSLEAARFGFKLFQSLWNLAGTSAALLPRCLSNFRSIWALQHPISRLRDFARFGGKTSYRLVNRGPVAFIWDNAYSADITEQD